MAIDDSSIIDLVSVNGGNSVNLTISDHLDWTAADEHLFLLREKINTYCKYIEGGQLYDEYPETRDRRPTIEIVFFHKPIAEAERFLERASSIVEQEGFSLHWSVYEHKENR